MMLEVQPFQEMLNASMCGAASLKIVLGYYGVDLSEAELADRVGVDPDNGAPAEALVAVAQELGFEAVIMNEATLDDIQVWLHKGVPVIVDWFTRGRNDYAEEIAIADGHYSVVCGLDDTYIYLQDPELGRVRKLERKAFEYVWFDFLGPFIKPDELIIRQLIAIYRK